MNIVIGQTNNADIIGLSAALAVMGHNVTYWDKNMKAPFDMCYEQKPDYIIVDEPNITQELEAALLKYKIRVITFGPKQMPNIDSVLSIVDADTPAIVKKNLCGTVYVINKAANIAQFRKGIYKRHLKAEIAYLSMKPIHSRYRNSMYNYLCSTLPNNGVKLKIYGQYVIPSSAYLGYIGHNDVANAFCSTDILLDSCLDMALDAAANKCFVLTNVPNVLFPHFDSEETLLHQIEKFKQNEKARKSIIKKAYKQVVYEHTYFNRVVDIAEILGEKEWIEQAKNMQAKLIN